MEKLLKKAPKLEEVIKALNQAQERKAAEEKKRQEAATTIQTGLRGRLSGFKQKQAKRTKAAMMVQDMFREKKKIKIKEKFDELINELKKLQEEFNENEELRKKVLTERIGNLKREQILLMAKSRAEKRLNERKPRKSKSNQQQNNTTNNRI